MPALFTRNLHLIDGILTDATWKIIRVSVASVLVLSIWNVGIPVMLAIDPKQDNILYEAFYMILEDHFNVNLNGYRAASDEGTALCAVCIDHKNKQFLHPRHVLVSLKQKMWNHETGTLIRCRVRDDFQ
jgi:hypothetical protein